MTSFDERQTADSNVSKEKKKKTNCSNRVIEWVLHMKHFISIGVKTINRITSTSLFVFWVAVFKYGQKSLNPKNKYYLKFLHKGFILRDSSKFRYMICMLQQYFEFKCFTHEELGNINLFSLQAMFRV